MDDRISMLNINNQLISIQYYEIMDYIDNFCNLKFSIIVNIGWDMVDFNSYDNDRDNFDDIHCSNDRLSEHYLFNVCFENSIVPMSWVIYISCFIIMIQRSYSWKLPCVTFVVLVRVKDCFVDVVMIYD